MKIIKGNAGVETKGSFFKANCKVNKEDRMKGKMKFAMKRDGKFVWIALKDDNGLYHNYIDPDGIVNHDIKLAGYPYLPETARGIKEAYKRDQSREVK